jgi:hypothetical protein
MAIRCRDASVFLYAFDLVEFEGDGLRLVNCSISGATRSLGSCGKSSLLLLVRLLDHCMSPNV